MEDLKCCQDDSAGGYVGLVRPGLYQEVEDGDNPGVVIYSLGQNLESGEQHSQMKNGYYLGDPVVNQQTELSISKIKSDMNTITTTHSL